VFGIGHILDPDEEFEFYNGQKLKNNAPFQAVQGIVGLYVQYANSRTDRKGNPAPIPVHIYDDTREGGAWFTWKDGKFVKEDPPTLTTKALLVGKEGQRKAKYKDVLGEKNFKELRNLFARTFGFESHYNFVRPDDRGLDINELGEVRQKINEEASRYTTSVEDIVPIDSARTKLALSLTSAQRRARVEMMALDFSRALTDILGIQVEGAAENELKAKQKAFDDLYVRLAPTEETPADEAAQNRKTIAAARRGLEKQREYVTQLLESDDYFAQRKLALQHVQLDGVFDWMKQKYRRIVSGEERSNLSDEQRAQYQLVLDNFDILVQEALEKVSHFENFRVIPIRVKNNGNLETTVVKPSVVQESEEEMFGDDTDGERSTGNDGWSYKVRMVDPRRTLSQRTKELLYHIPMLGDNGKVLLDDLGNTRYLNGEYAHAVLIDALSNLLIDADDFSVPIEWKTDAETGEKVPVSFRFPALEEVQKRYPWVKNLIYELEDDNSSVAAFFHDMFLDYINYEKIDDDGKVMPLNVPVAQESAKQQLVTNYENSVELSPFSVYSTGKINRDNAKYLFDRWRAVHMNFGHFGYNPDALSYTLGDGFPEKADDAIVDTLRALGFDVDKAYVKNVMPILFEKKGDIPAALFRELEKSVNTILAYISDPKGTTNFKFRDNDNYVISFKSQLNKICRIVGRISESDNVQSFREGKDARYSYSCVNAIATMVRSIRSDKRRKQYLDSEYKQDPFLFDQQSGKWKNEWLRILETDKYYREHLVVSEVIANGISKDFDDESTAFVNWTPGKVYNTLFAQYFRYETDHDSMEERQLAAYNFPIFSDAPACAFITMKRFRRDFKKQLMPLFVQVVEQELIRQSVVAERKANGAAEIQNFDDRGSKFCFFPELNSYVLPDGRAFQQVVDELVARGDYESLRNTIAYALTDILNSQFHSFLADVYSSYSEESVIAQLKTLGVIVKEEQDEDVLKRRAREAMEEFFYNSTYATSQIIQLTTTDIAYYKDAVDFQKRFKQEYASGHKLNTNVKYGRKTENTIYIADMIQTSSTYTGLQKSLRTAVSEGRITEGEANIILNKAKEINVADAQAYRNPYAFRAVLSMMGKWTDEMDESFNRLLRGEWDAKDLAVIYQTIKPFVKATVIADNGIREGKHAGRKMRVPHQNKNSEFLCLSFFSAIAAGSKDNPFLNGLGQFFMAHPDIDVIQYQSAVKSGGQGIINLNYSQDRVDTELEKIQGRQDYDKRIGDEASKRRVNVAGASGFDLLKLYYDNMLSDGTVSQDDYNKLFDRISLTATEIKEKLEAEVSVNGTIDTEHGIFDASKVHQLPYSAYMIAQPTPEHLMDEEEATSGSQYNYLILANLPDTFEITLPNGTRLNKKQMMEIYRSCVVDNLLDSFDSVKNLFSDIHELQKRLFKIIEGNPKYGQDIIDALQIVRIPSEKDPTGYKEVFNLPMDLPTICNQVQELLTSVFKNTITKRKINGGNCIQVACAGVSRNLNILRDDNGRITGCECMLPAWTEKFFKPFLKTRTETVKDKNGQSHTTTYKEIDI